MMFEGVFTALITPFRDGGVDEPALRELIEQQIAAGISGLVPCGSTGESATLSVEEHHQVIEIVIGAAAGRVPVLAGTGSNNTREAIGFTQHAKDAGAAGALLLSPYYNKPTQQGLVEHFLAIADETQFPLVLYNIPGRTASNVVPETIARLAEHEFIVGVKEACGDIDQIAQVIASCPDDFAVLSGDDSFLLPVLALGGKGSIAVTSNIAPKAMLSLYQSYLSGDVDRAREIHYELLPLFNALFCETNPIPVKAALALLGTIADDIRLPLTQLTQPNRDRLQAVLKEAGIL
ncbi:MAG: 4-hydroxy-tetrahydrodipicolinate synthase [Deltaproteobacteria bacterium]|nr:4-hydroxy-tetrahydrodipicolinate synthase [Deltaproteobacteria bacterium]